MTRRGPMPEEVKKKLASFDYTKVTDISRVPRWVKVALARRELLGISLGKVAREAQKNPGSLRSWLRAPAVQEWISEIRKNADDPRKAAEDILLAESYGLTFDYFSIYERAKAMGDLQLAERMARTMLVSSGAFTDRAREPSPPTIVLQIAGGNVPAIQAIEVESSGKLIEGEVEKDS